MVVSDTETVCFVVRESCYPFYEPSYTEPSHGCSQEVQIKKWQKEVAVRILRTQEWRRTQALDSEACEQCAESRRQEVVAPQSFVQSQARWA